jgi:hypothetical protein
MIIYVNKIGASNAVLKSTFLPQTAVVFVPFTSRMLIMRTINNYCIVQIAKKFEADCYQDLVSKRTKTRCRIITSVYFLQNKKSVLGHCHCEISRIKLCNAIVIDRLFTRTFCQDYMNITLHIKKTVILNCFNVVLRSG